MGKAPFFAPGLLLALLAAAPASALAAEESPPEKFAPNIELPEGEGKVLLEGACTKCHDLAGLEAYKGYWNRTHWRSMVDTMVRHGAELDEAQINRVTDYLTRFFGPGTR